MIVTESTRDLINKNYQSTSKLEVNENDKMSNIFIRDGENEDYRDDNEALDYTDYNRRIGELTEDIQQLEQIEEEKEEE